YAERRRRKPSHQVRSGRRGEDGLASHDVSRIRPPSKLYPTCPAMESSRTMEEVMNKLVAITVAVGLLAGCTMNAVTHPQAAQDCRDWGLKPGTTGYDKCVNRMSSVE